MVKDLFRIDFSQERIDSKIEIILKHITLQLLHNFAIVTQPSWHSKLSFCMSQHVLEHGLIYAEHTRIQYI